MWRHIYCIVLCWWGGHCCPMHCDLFKIYCAPPNLGITRTWIWRLNFAQRPFFQALGSLTSLKSQTGDSQVKVPPGGLVLRIFTPWKSSSTLAGFEPANLGSRSEHFTPRPPRPTEGLYTVGSDSSVGWGRCIRRPLVVLEKSRLIPAQGLHFNLPHLIFITHILYQNKTFPRSFQAVQWLSSPLYVFLLAPH